MLGIIPTIFVHTILGVVFLIEWPDCVSRFDLGKIVELCILRLFILILQFWSNYVLHNSIFSFVEKRLVPSLRHMYCDAWKEGFAKILFIPRTSERTYPIETPITRFIFSFLTSPRMYNISILAVRLIYLYQYSRIVVIRILFTQELYHICNILQRPIVHCSCR